jgi:Fur family transcriptional regulator, peroxide stress response regulator
MNSAEIRQQLMDHKLKVTPQRVAVLEAIHLLNNHPTAERISDCIRQHHPNISVATVYKVLDVLVDNQLVKRVKTDKDVMRYDARMQEHHHLYCAETDRIEDYIDSELSTLIAGHFDRKGIHGFEIEDIKLQIIGRFKVVAL